MHHMQYDWLSQQQLGFLFEFDEGSRRGQKLTNYLKDGVYLIL